MPIFFVCAVLYIADIQAQEVYKLDRNKYSLGKIENWQNDTFWFELTNVSNKPWFILSQFYSQDFQVLYTTRPVEPGYSTLIGLIYYTESRGSFSVEVPMYINVMNESIDLKLKGFIKSIDPSAIDRCPPIRRGTDYALTIPHAKKVQRFNIDDKKEEEVKNLEGTKVTIALEVESEYQFEENFIVEEEENEIIPKQVNKEETKLIIKDDPDQFSNLDRPNNIVIVIDRSRSMSSDGKFEQLQKSLSKLIEALRPQDIISIISYSRVVKVLCEGIKGSNKNDLISRVNMLEPIGGSYGGKGMDMAYDFADKYYIREGNNVIILATDGKFTDKDFSEEKLYFKAKRKNIMKNIKLSGIGYGKDPRALDFIEKLSISGGGRYIEVNKTEDSELLILKLVKDISRN